MADVIRPTLDLRSKPAQTAPAAFLPGHGIPPLQAGVVRKVTKAEAAVLAEAGWQPGEPIPGNFAEVRKALLEQQQTETAQLLPVAPDTPPLEVDIKPIESLGPEQRAYLRQAMDEVRQANANIAPAAVMAVPGINDALRTAGDATVQTGVPSAGAFMGMAQDDGTRQAPRHFEQNLLPTAAATVPSPPPTKSIDVNPVQEQDAGSTSSYGAIKHCPNCECDLTKPQEVEASGEDKLNFLIALEGQQRFRKEYSLFGGNFRVVFRQPTTAEAHVLFEQLAVEFQQGELVDQGGYFAQMLKYRLTLSIESVDGPKGRVSVPLLDDVLVDTPKPGEPKKTVLPELHRHIREVVLPNESLYHVVVKAYQDFQRLVDHIEANWNNADFFKGIRGPR